MKKILVLSLVAGISAATISGCNSKTDTITIATWGEYFDRAGDHSEMKALLKEESGYNIRFVTFADNEELESKMKTTDFDLVIPSDYMAAKLMNANMLQKLNLSELGLSKEKFTSSINSVWSEYENGELWEYALPLAAGDLRVMWQGDALQGVTGEDANREISVVKLFDQSSLYVGMHDDARNAALIAMNYYSAKNNLNLTSEQLGNPDVAELEKAFNALKNSAAAKAGKISLLDDTDLAIAWSQQNKVNVAISYNATPLWIFEENSDQENKANGWTIEDGWPTNYSTAHMAESSNLWIDAIAMTTNAKEGTIDVLKAIWDNYSELDVHYNCYTSTLQGTYDEMYGAGGDYEDDYDYALSGKDDHYVVYNYRKEMDSNYNSKINEKYIAFKSSIN